MSTNNTCGLCLEGFVGEEGDSNIACFDIIPALNQTDLECNSDDDCESFARCDLLDDLTSGTCTILSKACEADCYGQGSCIYIDVNTGLDVETCNVFQSTCYPQCTCDEGYFGSNCFMNNEEYQARTSMRLKMLDGVNVMDPDPDPIAIKSAMSSFTSVTTRYDEISAEGVANALENGFKFLDVGLEVKMSADDATGLFDSMVAMSLIQNESISGDRRRLMQLLTLLKRRKLIGLDASVAYSQSKLIEKYSTLALNNMVAGVKNVEKISSGMRFLTGVSEVVDNGNVSYASMSTPTTKLETLNGDKPFDLKLYVTKSAQTASGIKLGVGVINSNGYGTAAEQFNSHPMSLVLENMGQCGNEGCKVEVIIQNRRPVQYVGHDVNVSTDLKTYITWCDGTDSTFAYDCPGFTSSLMVECQDGFVGNMTSYCPYNTTSPSCNIISPDTLSSGYIGMTSDMCVLKSFTEVNTTCECQLSRNSRRRLATMSANFQLTTTTGKAAIYPQAVLSPYIPPPTFSPTFPPTLSPTYAPGSPTFKPSPIPTLSPTPSYIRVKIEVKQTIDGLPFTDFDDPQKLKNNGRIIVLAVTNTINRKTNWTLSENDVNLLNVASSRRRRLTNGIAITYTVKGGGQGLDATQAVAAMTSALSDSSSFGSNLQQARTVLAGSYTGAFTSTTQLTIYAPAVQIIAVGTPSPTLAPTEAPPVKVNNTTLIVIVASVAGGVLLMAFAAFFMYRRLQPPKITYYIEDEKKATPKVNVKTSRRKDIQESKENDDSPINLLGESPPVKFPGSSVGASINVKKSRKSPKSGAIKSPSGTYDSLKFDSLKMGTMKGTPKAETKINIDPSPKSGTVKGSPKDDNGIKIDPSPSPKSEIGINVESSPGPSPSNTNLNFLSPSPSKSTLAPLSNTAEIQSVKGTSNLPPLKVRKPPKKPKPHTTRKKANLGLGMEIFDSQEILTQSGSTLFIPAQKTTKRGALPPINTNFSMERDLERGSPLNKIGNGSGSNDSNDLNAEPLLDLESINNGSIDELDAEPVNMKVKEKPKQNKLDAHQRKNIVMVI